MASKATTFTITKNFKGLADPQEIARQMEQTVDSLLDAFNAFAQKQTVSLQSLQTQINHLETRIAALESP